MGVWIETKDLPNYAYISKSLPTWECGLKQDRCFQPLSQPSVTPHVGVWIETPYGVVNACAISSHSPRGSVD